jgi:hypothetical protein
MVQMLAMGDIRSLEEGRSIVRESFDDESRVFKPTDSEAWQAAFKNWSDIRNN